MSKAWKKKTCAQKDSRFNRNSSSVNIEKNISATITSDRSRRNYEANTTCEAEQKRKEKKKPQRRRNKRRRSQIYYTHVFMLKLRPATSFVCKYIPLFNFRFRLVFTIAGSISLSISISLSLARARSPHINANETYKMRLQKASEKW